MSYDKHDRMVQLIWNHISSHLTGSHPDFDNFVGDPPNKKFIAGNLAPRLKEEKVGKNLFHDEDSKDDEVGSDPRSHYLTSQFSPRVFGLVFYLDTSSSESNNLISVNGYFYVFHRQFPNYRDFLKHLNVTNASELTQGEKEYSVPGKWKRTKVMFTLSFNINDLIPGKYIKLMSLTKELESVITNAINDIELYRFDTSYSEESARRQYRIKREQLLDEASYDDWIGSRTHIVRPKWEASIWAQLIVQKERNIITIILENDSWSYKRGTRASENPHDPFLFNPKLFIEIEHGNPKPINLSIARARDYRYEPRVWCLGRNCDALLDRSKDGIIHYETYIFPIYKQFRYSTHQISVEGFVTLSEGWLPEFKELSDNPLDSLNKIHIAMKKYIECWKKSFNNYVELDDISNESETEYNLGLQEFEKEVKQFELGLKILRGDSSLPPSECDKIITAFRLMNETFAVLNRGTEIRAWRLFQLVFIVSAIPDIIARTPIGKRIGLDYPPDVRVLWFPTGGGKTEAYLGLVVFHSFWDRLRAKSDGVTAWARFPLRLLGLQQFQRAIKVITAADYVRKKTMLLTAEQKGANFSVGFFVGEDNSPNWPNKKKQGKKSELEKMAEDNDLASKYKIIEACPYCRLMAIENGLNDPKSGLHIKIDLESERIIHQCSNPDCPSGGNLPIYISDVEVCRFLPTFLIGTIDKMAVFGARSDYYVLLGGKIFKCSEGHGYSFDNKCHHSHCNARMSPIILNDGGPGLVIQDELHLINESLGAFSGHYETYLSFYSELLQEKNKDKCFGPWNVVAATATIAGYSNQIHHLYNRKSVRFPCGGPTRFENFYAETIRNDTQRYIVGFRPHNSTHLQACQLVLQYFHEYVNRLCYLSSEELVIILRSLDPLFRECTSKDAKEIIEAFRTSLAYAIAKNELYQLIESVQPRINPYLEAKTIPPIKHLDATLTGDTRFERIREILRILENPFKEEWIDFVGATSTVSHGVDIDTLNFMMFRGQPRSMSEFIQALSRVGRRWVGLVTMIYNPTRIRDYSHFQYHRRFMDYKEALVENVPINRYAIPVLEKTIPGLFFGIVISILERSSAAKLWNKNRMKAWWHINKPNMEKTILEYLKKSLGLPPSELCNIRERRLMNEIQQILDTTTARLYKGETEWTTTALGCLTSLRDVDEEVEVDASPDLIEALDQYGGGFFGT